MFSFIWYRSKCKNDGKNANAESNIHSIWTLKLLASLSFLLLLACQTTNDESGSGKEYLKGVGIAKFHNYRNVKKCKTAFGLDPEAFAMRVTAASSQITKKFPTMGKVGKRQGPYDSTARCIKVRRLGTEKFITVRAIDICCGADLSNPNSHQLDLSEQAFERLAPTRQGLVKVSWAVVDCPVSLQVKSDDALCDDNFYFVR